MNHGVTVREEPDRWILDVPPWEITRCMIDHAFWLELDYPPSGITVRIEGPFRVKVGGVTRELTPGRPAELCPALAILHNAVSALTAHKDGMLQVRLVTDDLLTVMPDPEYEAWEIVDSAGLRFVSLPGGGLATWLPKA